MRQSDRIAAQLRDAATRIERHATGFARVGQPGRATYSNTAGQIFSEITVALSNAPIDLLIETAGETDIHRAQRLAGTAAATDTEPAGSN